MDQPQYAPWTTQNEPLAFALYTAGFRMLKILNDYTDAKLDALKFQTVTAAKQAGKRGDVTYVFEWAEDLMDALHVWDETGKALKAKDTVATGVERKVVMGIFRALMFGEKAWGELWKAYPARYIKHHDGEVTSEITGDGRTREKHPGFTIMSENLSPENQAKLFSK